MSNYDSLYLTGAQQVSIFPYQTLSSVYGNEVFYGLFDPGIYYSNISLSNGASNTILRVSINAGTTLMFMRQHVNPDDPTKTETVLGKIVITSPNFIDMLKSDIWLNVGTYAAATKLYIVADWHYNVTSSSERYVSFTLETDLSSIQALDGTASHKIIVATLSNHQWFVSNYSATNSNLYNYHIAYEYQSNRDPLKRLFAHNNNFNLTFASDGCSVIINPGNTWTGSTFLSLTTPQTITPAVGLTNYVTSPVTNTTISIIGSESSYYQVDFLRAKTDENSGTVTYGWDSVLVTGTGTGSINGNSLGWSNNSVSQQDLMNYIQQFRYYFKGEGLTLLVAVRPRANVPTVDGPGNVLWPENCVVFKDNSIEATQVAEGHARFKIPVWNSSDLGYV